MSKPTYGLKVVVLPDVKLTGKNISLDPDLFDTGDQVQVIRKALRNSGLSGNNTLPPSSSNSLMTSLQEALQGKIGYAPTINVQATGSITCSNCLAEFIITKKPRRVVVLANTVSCPFCGTRLPYK